MKHYLYLKTILLALILSFTACGGGGGGGGESALEIEMVRLNNDGSASFSMGQSGISGATPVRTVKLTQGFYMSKYQITQKQWEDVMGTTIDDQEATTSWGLYGKGVNHPMYYVNWYEAIVFCNKLSIEEGFSPAYEIQKESDTTVWSTNPADWDAVPTSSNSRWNAVRIVASSTGYRLPTEAQWEYACRAGATGDYGLSEDKVNEINSTTLGNYAWYSDNSDGKTHAVRGKKPNAWGLYDMHGNVWEWCWDWHGTYVDSPPNENPLGASSGSLRVVRGGSWYDSAVYLRSAIRSYVFPYGRDNDFGFRLVRP